MDRELTWEDLEKAKKDINYFAEEYLKLSEFQTFLLKDIQRIENIEFASTDSQQQNHSQDSSADSQHPQQRS